MKYYSEILNKLFDTQEEVSTAEAEAKAEQERIEKEKAAQEAEKELLLNDLKEKNAQYEEAVDNLKKVKKEAEELESKVLDALEVQIQDMLDGAYNLIEEKKKALDEVQKSYNERYSTDEAVPASFDYLLDLLLNNFYR